VPGLMPTDAQNPGRPLDVSRLEHVDGQPLTGGRESGARLRLRQADLPDPCVGHSTRGGCACTYVKN
jgi:hypothetical protein